MQYKLLKMKNKNLVTCCNLYKLMGLEKDEYIDITKSLGRYFLYTKDYVATEAFRLQEVSHTS